MNIVQALDDPRFFAPWFSGSSWDPWRAILKAAFALPMSQPEIDTFRSLAERDPPTSQVRELWVIAGRRSGKDSIASLIAAYFGAFRDYSALLRPGERALIMNLACDRSQAKIVARYTKGYFDEVPLLTSVLQGGTDEAFELSNGAEVAIHTNSFRAVRGRTIACVIMDEVAYWRSEESANPDLEVYNAVTPGLSAPLKDTMLIGISSPYRRGGLLFNKWRKHYGQPGDVLVIKAPSTALNPTLDPAIIARAMEEDPEAASSEWMAEWRSDLADFVDRQVVDAATVLQRYELPRSKFQHKAFVDPSGGSSDSMTLAIAHRDAEGKGILDAIREVRPPFSPEDVVTEFSALLKQYGIYEVTGDRYAGEWPRERFKLHGVTYVPCEKSKSDIYREFLPILNAGRIELLDHLRLTAQLCSLERRTSRGTGRDSIDHPPGAHDDIANSAAGVLVTVAGQPSLLDMWVRLGQDAPDAPPPPRPELKPGHRWINSATALHFVDSAGGCFQIPAGRSVVNPSAAEAIARSSWRHILEQ